MTRSAPPPEFDDNPPLDKDFFDRAQPAKPGDAIRLRRALKAIVDAHIAGKPVDRPIAEARQLLTER